MLRPFWLPRRLKFWQLATRKKVSLTQKSWLPNSNWAQTLTWRVVPTITLLKINRSDTKIPIITLNCTVKPLKSTQGRYRPQVHKGDFWNDITEAGIVRSEVLLWIIELSKIWAIHIRRFNCSSNYNLYKGIQWDLW